MGFEFIKKLPTPDEIRNQYPIEAKIKLLKRNVTVRSVIYLLENPISFLPSSVPALQTMKMLYVITC